MAEADTFWYSRTARGDVAVDCSGNECESREGEESVLYWEN